jgi:cytochrome c-type biogenesis protein CcmE
MTDVTWADSQDELAGASRGINAKFVIGGALILVAVGLLVAASTLSSGQPFVTVEDLLTREDLVGKTVQTSGAVVGETIALVRDTEPTELRFTIAHISADMAHIEDEGGLAQALYLAANSTDAPRMDVVIYDQPKPDLLQHEAQAILTGTMGEDGVFYATDLMLKCPTRYSDDTPDQVGS